MGSVFILQSIADFSRNERLKELIVTGVKKIRHCVVGLQTARPALIFEPPKMLTAGESTDTPSSRAYPWLPIVSVPPPVPDGVLGSRRRQRAIENATDAIEPSDSQFETASWLYNITLAKPEDSKTGDSVAEDRAFHADQTSVPGQPDARHMEVITVLPPRQLYNLSIPSVVHKLIRNGLTSIPRNCSMI